MYWWHVLNPTFFRPARGHEGRGGLFRYPCYHHTNPKNEFIHAFRILTPFRVQFLSRLHNILSENGWNVWSKPRFPLCTNTPGLQPTLPTNNERTWQHGTAKRNEHRRFIVAPVPTAVPNCHIIQENTAHCKRTRTTAKRTALHTVRQHSTTAQENATQQQEREHGTTSQEHNNKTLPPPLLGGMDNRRHHHDIEAKRDDDPTTSLIAACVSVSHHVINSKNSPNNEPVPSLWVKRGFPLVKRGFPLENPLNLYSSVAAAMNAVHVCSTAGALNSSYFFTWNTYIYWSY